MYAILSSRPTFGIYDGIISQDPTFKPNQVPSGGGHQGSVVDTLINGRIGMVDNDSSIWSPNNKLGSLKMAYGKVEGPPSSGVNMDPVFNGGNKLQDKFQRPTFQPLTKKLYNFL